MQMRRFLTRQAATVLALCLLAISCALSASAQTADEAPEAEQNSQESNLRTLLNLTPEQVRQIRAIRRENRLEWQAARQRLREARLALDQAIYSDDTSDAAVEQRAREVAEAQAAEVRLRAMTELSIRRVLTPEQLNTFRSIREQRRQAAAERRRAGAAARASGRARRRPLLNQRQRPALLPGGIRP
jgi:Spy/CpxP family protein refolding chaperone